MQLTTETQPTHCPYCGEHIELVVDLSVETQEYTEDCFVCCRPMIVVVSAAPEGVYLAVRREDE